MSRSRTRMVALVVSVVLVTGACSFAAGSDTTTGRVTTTTTGLVFPEASSTTTTLAPDVDEAVAAELKAAIAELIETTEAVRGLQFLEDPPVVVMSPEALRARQDERIETSFEQNDIDDEGRLFDLVGLLNAPTDLRRSLAVAHAYDAPGFYDEVTGELVVSGATSDLSPLQRSILVHELINALTDQHFSHTELIETFRGEGREDRASALDALREGDATYFQFVYIQSLPVEERQQIGEAGEPLSQPVSSPAWLQDAIAFPYDSGLDFVERLVTGGGIAAVDRAYLEPPESTEQILHPGTYERGEVLRPVPDLELELDGYELRKVSTFGELNLRLMLKPTLGPGVLSQTADGWGADAYGLLVDEDDVVFVYTYAGDTETDAIEVAQGLVAHARDTMGAGVGVDSGGGILFDEGGPYVFVDRIGDGLVFVASTEPAAGRALRSQVRVP